MYMTIQESAEMYLETILVLGQKKEKVRSVDVAEYMGFSKPAVSRAMSKLKEAILVEIQKDGAITLTEKGGEIAKGMYERHVILTQFLISIGVNKETAEKDACKIEHCLSGETFAAMKKHHCENCKVEKGLCSFNLLH